jgi:DNA primase
VARFPGGKDPGELAQSDPEALAAAVGSAPPFLGFRLDRVLQGQSPQSPEQRARLGEVAMAVINEHPNSNVRKLYAGQVAAQVGLPVADLVQLAERGVRHPQLNVSATRSRRGQRENAEFVAITQLVQDWDSIAPWLVESLFADELYRRAFLAIAAAGGDLGSALAQADPEAREVLERAAVVDLEVEAEVEARNLIAAAVRRELGRTASTNDPALELDDRDARLRLEDLGVQEHAADAAEWLLVWLAGRTEGR